MNDATRAWLEPMVRELQARPDAIAVLTSVETGKLPMQALAVIGALGRDEPVTADEVDWVGVGTLLREALGWTDYPAVPEN
ncbi:hypothetical protein [Mycolicibacterium brumae]|uniref:Uncharacterized protein n=1 Tax=Mycolicibacterium brumae TaxID=85968 RepID=A0A2G5P7T5_9MYCO|nr:hypothetical protein [Mycolicibacterium brumae]MCV7194108.1 hypothetical protein [Mycolicibacterium brumae]PIB74422.1 hypothetical protein CQY22_013215 [Mycolicibacterium brumae]RWA22719.1 hypothetical protein MBRU_12275 [Mycolicibacterium brumae DSM 44177]UWW07475.1 hypothetical protein L2Z93_000490 [Mycolicibacterium brumae]